MALRQPFRKGFVSNLNDATFIPLDAEGFYFSAPKFDEEGPQARIRLTALEDHEHQGSEVITYSRMDISEWASRLVRPPQLHRLETTHAMLSRLVDEVGIFFTPEDVLDGETFEVEGGFVIPLVMADDNPRWRGSVDLLCHPLPDIDQVATYTQLQW